MSEINEGEGVSSPPMNERRLDSWKEIASYLRRDVKTVQRWEKTEELPVHRHTHKKRATIYAYPSEIDSWLAERAKARNDLNGGSRAPKTKAPWPRTVTLVAACFLSAIVGLWVASELPSIVPVEFEERDWILIASFENRTGNPLFDEVIEYALSRELGDSRFVNVVPRVRIEDTLSLMRLRPDAVVDVALAQEIAVRDPEIRMVLAGRTEALGERYVLTAELIDARSRVIVAATSAEILEDDHIVYAVRSISDWARLAVGEPLPPTDENELPVERVTTRSLEALRLYSQAMALRLRDGYPEVGDRQITERLLRQALEYDDEFASAHIMLAELSRNLPEEYLLHAERALALAPTVSHRERYFIRGSYRGLLGQREQAVEEYRTLLQLYPDDFWGTSNLVRELTRLRRTAERRTYVARAADLRPTHLLMNMRALTLLLQDGSDEARKYYDRIRTLVPELSDLQPHDRNILSFFSAFEAWRRGDALSVLNEANRIRREDLTGVGDDLAMLYAALGRLRIAKEFEDEDGTFTMGDLLVAFSKSTFEEDLLNLAFDGPPSFNKAILLARAGRLEQAEEIAPPPRDGQNDRYHSLLDIVQGELAHAWGRDEDALRLLMSGLALAESQVNHPIYYLGAETLAVLLEDSGDVTGAVQVLERWGPRDRIGTSGGRGYWGDEVLRIRNRWNLAQLYRRVGRTAAAEEIESELRNLLAYADEDHFIARQLAELESDELAAVR